MGAVKDVNPLQRAIGLVLLMIGAVWFMLGSGMIGGSVMSGQTVWAIVGAMIAIVGLWIVTRRPSTRGSQGEERDDEADEEGADEEGKDTEASRD